MDVSRIPSFIFSSLAVKVVEPIQMPKVLAVPKDKFLLVGATIWREWTARVRNC